MKNLVYKLLTIGIIILFFGSSVPSYLANIIVEPNDYPDQDMNLNGRILFTPEYSKNAYLINYDGDIINSWNCENLQGIAVYMLENGDILRSDYPYFNPRFIGGGVTGRVAKYDWEGTLKWEFIYSNEQHCLHHDIEPLPNGNILMTAWEYKTRNQAIKEGRDPAILQTGGLWSDYIIEVEPSDTIGGKIVWEWHAWDHLVQDYDSTKENFGVVAENPQLININIDTDSIDWLHTNAIDYNEQFDQILITVNFFNEIWVIDHSTTTAEASGHIGGNSGKGGDLLYRWGNPQVYNRGNSNDRQLFLQHDAKWIEPGCPGEGNILIFNNGLFYPGSPESVNSSLIEIMPPVDNNGIYYLETGLAFGPEIPIWTYETDFCASIMSGVQRLPNGNTLFCNGPTGEFFEINPEKEIIWEYDNPYPYPFQNDVFKIQHYPTAEADLDCEGSLNWDNAICDETLTGEFTLKNMGGPGSLLDWKIKSYPDWGTWTFNPEIGENLEPTDTPVTILVSVIVPNEQNKKFEGEIIVVNQEDPEDTDVIPVILKTQRNRSIKLSFLEYIKNHLSLFQLLKLLLQQFKQ